MPEIKKIHIILRGLTAVEYSEILEVPATMRPGQLDALVKQRYDEVCGSQYTDDPDYWERGDCRYEIATESDAADGKVIIRAGTMTVEEIEQVANQPKHYIGKLKETNGELEYTHVFRFLADDPTLFLDGIASRFYDEDGGDQDGESYSFKGGALVVRPAGYQEIPRDLYTQLHGIVTGL